MQHGVQQENIADDEMRSTCSPSDSLSAIMGMVKIMMYLNESTCSFSRLAQQNSGSKIQTVVIDG
jgi:hypothetical protein